MFYLERAKDWAGWAGVTRIDGDLSPDECLAKAQTCALISIAGSLESTVIKNTESDQGIFLEIAKRLSALENITHINNSSFEAMNKRMCAVEEAQGEPESVTVKLSVLKEIAQQVARIELLSDWDESNWVDEAPHLQLMNAIHAHTCTVADILEEFTGETFPRGTFTSPAEGNQCE